VPQAVTAVDTNQSPAAPQTSLAVIDVQNPGPTVIADDTADLQVHHQADATASQVR
jgi:hypothetical protein